MEYIHLILKKNIYGLWFRNHINIYATSSIRQAVALRLRAVAIRSVGDHISEVQKQ